MNMIKRTPYHHKFVELGATFVDRMGLAAPLVFTSTEDEHRATRERVGVFDVYYQIALEVVGKDAETLLQMLLVVDVARLAAGRAVYSSLCNDQGGMIDDLTCFRLAPQRFWFFPTPSRILAVLDALNARGSGLNVAVTNLGYKNAFISIQGPRSRELLGKLTSVDLSTARVPYFSFVEAMVADVPGTLLSRTGYSGELGYELFYPVEYAEHMWDRVFEAGTSLGVKACGLGALRTLRLEKKYILYGLDADETTTPLEAGLGWTVKFQKDDFIGKQALERQKQKGLERQLVLIEFDGLDFVPDISSPVAVDGTNLGRVTSADRGYSVGKSLAMAYLAVDHARQGQQVVVTSAQGSRPGTVHTKPIYDPRGDRLRA
jgi:aminomethyltransferase